MKKVLFATTALVALAGAASADVALSGSAEIGVIGGDRFGNETQFHTHVDVTFTLSGETDGGISFGASVDLDEADNINGGSEDGVAIFISGDFGTLTLGDTDGALDWALTEASVANAGSITDDETEHAAYFGSYGDGAYDGQILRYDYSFGDFAAAFSVELDDTDTLDDGFAIGARYNLAFGGGSVAFGAGYQVFEVDGVDGFLPGNLDDELVFNFGFPFTYVSYDVTMFGVSAAVSLDSGLQASISYTVMNGDDTLPGSNADFENTHLGLSAGYSFDAITVSANYGMWDLDDGFGVSDTVTGFGFAAAYDLGGGLSAHLGYGVSDYDAANETSDSFSLGLAMSF